MLKNKSAVEVGVVYVNPIKSGVCQKGFRGEVD